MRRTDTDRNQTDETAKPGKKKAAALMRFGLTFMAGFIAAGFAFWLFAAGNSDNSAPAAVPAVSPEPARREIGENALAAFLDAAARKDFAAMRDVGQREFAAGTLVRGGRDRFAAYETSSFPPNTTYSFYSDQRDGMVYRILMTIGNDDVVVAFLAEEMRIAQ